MKNRNSVNLNVNPCKMCMPMGAVTAFKGIENTMMILHGSQGCSTYIRRHMAGHYNEPVDLASSSLSEEGTVYGGENNLKKGLQNMISLYNPSLIGVATTCLAETIGEDIKRITDEYVSDNPEYESRIIPVPTPGYGGTQFEGYFAALLNIVKVVTRPSEKSDKVNIIIGNMNPGDVRNIKSIVERLGIDAVFLPDISETLDAPYKKSYNRVPDGGTKLNDIACMSGSAGTIEIGLCVKDEFSPGRYLEEKYGVPLVKVPLPIGLRGTDMLVNALCKMSAKTVPTELKKERGRLIDGMIDSHKHNSEGRAAIYGEPDFVLGMANLCIENGIKPVLIATGSESNKVNNLLDIIDLTAKPLIIDDTDFETIRDYAIKLNANLLIGSSDGKFITERDGIPLVRAGFPIHDRIGGQRKILTGYEGSLRFLDEITNTLLENKYSTYRKDMYDAYYKKEDVKKSEMEVDKRAVRDLETKTKEHPCFSSGVCSNARMHIPVAPKCNISCNYCNRKYDCVNESRPGVTSEVLSPMEALIKFTKVKEKLSNLKVIGIAGPGDALANFDDTKKSIELIREVDPDITFCLSTNGLMLPFYAEELASLGVTHVTVTINAIDPMIGAKIYRQISYIGKKYYGVKAAEILLENQLNGLKMISSLGVITKVNIVMIKGVNEAHIPEVVKKVKECGATMTNIMPLIPAPGSVFENMPLTSNKELTELRKICALDLKQMYHCRQCRADAIGILGEDVSQDFNMKNCVKKEKINESLKSVTYKFAVASSNGFVVDQHFGHADEFYIYESNGEISRFVEKRSVSKYCNGQEFCDDEDSKIDKIVGTIKDCDAVVILRIGYRPSKELEARNIKIIQSCGKITDVLEQEAKKLLEKDTTKEIINAAK